MGALQVVTVLPRQLFQSRAQLAAENLALRQQGAVLQRPLKRPRLHRRDRIFWGWLSRLWRDWRSSLLVVQPETVLRWHREGNAPRPREIEPSSQRRIVAEPEVGGLDHRTRRAA